MSFLAIIQNYNIHHDDEIIILLSKLKILITKYDEYMYICEQYNISETDIIVKDIKNLYKELEVDSLSLL